MSIEKASRTALRPGVIVEGHRQDVRARLVEAALVTLLAVLVATLLSFRAPAWTDLDSDQWIINLMVLKELNPELLSRDALYGREYAQFYIPLYVRLQALLSVDGNYLTGFQWLTFGTAVVFFLTHYFFFRALGARAVFALLGTLSAMTLRQMFGAEYWGFNGYQLMHPRNVANAVTPLLLLVFLRWRSSWQILAYFLLTGILVSIHPVSGLHLFLTGALAHLVIERLRPRAWIEIVGGAGLFALGAAPFLLQFLSGRDNVTDMVMLSLVRQVQAIRWYYLLLPLKLTTVAGIGSQMVLPLLLCLWLWRRGGVSEEIKRLWVFGAVAFVGAFLGTAAIQLLAGVTNRPYLTVEHLRMSKLVYPAILVAFPLAYQRLWDRRRWGAGMLLLLLLVMALIPPKRFIIASSGLRAETRRVLGFGTPARPEVGQLVQSEHAGILWDWVRRETPKDALFFTDSLHFRVATERAITGAFKDGGIAVLAGTRPLYEWSVYITEVHRCRARSGDRCWFALAHASGADFVVVDPTLRKARPSVGFTMVWERGAWSLWKRGQP